MAATVKPGSGGETQGKGAAGETDGGRRRPAGGGFFFKKNVCRVYFGHSAKFLPSVRQKTLGKVCLPIKIHRVSFAECFLGFAECQGHLANLLILVVLVVNQLSSQTKLS